MDIYGWAVIRETYSAFDDDYDDTALHAVCEDVKSRFDPSDSNVRMDLRYLNGTAVLQVALAKNRYTPASEELIDLFRYVGRVAPGSYGLLHLNDDGPPYGDNTMHVLVLARGRLARRVDPFLTPLIPRTEDWSPGSTLSEHVPRYLPLGSVVSLHHDGQKLMIIGRHHPDPANESFADYLAVPYPGGEIGTDARRGFNHEAIAEIHYIGFIDEDETAEVTRLRALP